MTHKDDTGSKWEPDRFTDPDAKFDPTASEALKALDLADAEVLSAYLYELSLDLVLIGQLFGTLGNWKLSLNAASRRKNSGSSAPSSTDAAEDWEGSPTQFRAAFERGCGVLVESYLQDAARVIGRLGRAISADPQEKEIMRLEIKRRRRGRPETPLKDAFKESATVQKVRLDMLHSKKKEASVQAAMTATGHSRATVHRHLAQSKKPRN